MPIIDYYNPIWDTTRQALPDRIFEDEHVIIAGTFECGNGCRIQRLDNSQYAVHINVSEEESG
tara:strand:- start:146 stop:334 length:189 start_codon:yes stop_codon:yes gene_type:complete